MIMIMIMIISHLRCHESLWWRLARSSQRSHSGPRDEVEVLLSVGVEEGHPPVGGVVGRHLEGDDLELGQTRGHAEHLPPVCWLVDISLGRLRVRHPCRVSAHDVETRPGRHPGNKKYF